MNYVEIVQELNEQLFELKNPIEFEFSYQTDGYCHVILFCEMTVWRSDEDNRNYSEEEHDGFEPLKPYLIRRVKAIVQELSSIKFE